MRFVATPAGAPVAMAHSNKCTSDLNAWVALFSEFAEAIGRPVSQSELFDLLLGAADSDTTGPEGLLAYNFLSGEHLIALADGRPLLVRRREGRLTLANLMRAHGEGTAEGFG